MKHSRNTPRTAVPLPDALSGLRQMLGASPAGAAVPADGVARATVTMARRILEARRLREAHLPIGLFTEPAWDMLLDLYIAEGEDRAMSAGSLCASARMPPKTALRWIGSLETEGCVVQVPDAKDGARALVKLTDMMRRAMRTYLAAIA